jgi:hypothetical protein
VCVCLHSGIASGIASGVNCDVAGAVVSSFVPIVYHLACVCSDTCGGLKCRSRLQGAVIAACHHAGALVCCRRGCRPPALLCRCVTMH